VTLYKKTVLLCQETIMKEHESTVQHVYTFNTIKCTSFSQG